MIGLSLQTQLPIFHSFVTGHYNMFYENRPHGVSASVYFCLAIQSAKSASLIDWWDWTWKWPESRGGVVIYSGIRLWHWCVGKVSAGWPVVWVASPVQPLGNLFSQSIDVDWIQGKFTLFSGRFFLLSFFFVEGSILKLGNMACLY